MSTMSLKNLVLHPLKGAAHEPIPVPEWDGAKVIVRAPVAGDYAAWRLAIREAAGVDASDTEESAKVKIASADLGIANALMLCRVLYEDKGKDVIRRALTDEDAPLLAASWTDVHERLLAKALTLSGVPDEETAKNSSAESPTSA